MLLSQCLVGDGRPDQRQAHLFEDIFEDFDDGALCALCLPSERNSEALPVLPSAEEHSMLSNNSKGKLPDSLRCVAPQRFATSSLVQTLTYIDNLLPGTELEVHTTTSPHAATLRPMIKGVRVLMLPYLEFEYCNVYRGTYGNSLPLIHRHSDAIVILWNKGDHDHVFFLTMSQLLPCPKDMQANSWSMVVFWNETKSSVARAGPDVGLDFTDQPAPAPDMPPQPPAGEDEVDHPGYDDPHGDMPMDDEDMPRLRTNTRNRISTMILLSWIQVVILRRSLPPQVPVPGREHDDSDLERFLDSDETGGNDRGLDMGHRQMSRLWSITTRLLLQEVRLVLLRFLSLLIVRRRDPIFLVQISHNVSTPILRRRWLTMLGDLLPMRNSLDSWAVSRVRREAGSLMRTGMRSFLTEPKPVVVRNQSTRLRTTLTVCR